MEIATAQARGKILIKSYSLGQFEIGEDVYLSSIFLCGNAVFKLDVAHIEDLSTDTLAKLFDAQTKADVFLIGWGSRQGCLNNHLSNALKSAGIGVDVEMIWYRH